MAGPVEDPDCGRDMGGWRAAESSARSSLAVLVRRRPARRDRRGRPSFASRSRRRGAQATGEAGRGASCSGHGPARPPSAPWRGAIQPRQPASAGPLRRHAARMPWLRLRHAYEGSRVGAPRQVPHEPAAGTMSVASVAHLVHEGQRARLALEDEAGVAPHHRLDLGLDLRRHAQGRNGLDIETPIGLEQLESGK